MQEKYYKYVICLLTERCYEDFVEGRYIVGDGMPVCVDFTCALHFDTVEEAHTFAKENQLELGEYAIHGYYF